MKEEIKVKLIVSDLYNQKNRIDSLLAKIVNNYYKSLEEEKNPLLFWIRDREIDNLKLATEKFFYHLKQLVNIKKKLMGK